MLPKLHRLSSVSIKSVMRAGQRRANGLLQIVFLHQKEMTGWHGAVVVSTAVDKRAVIRNRIKRLIHESLRLHSSEPLHGYDFVIIVKKGFVPDTQAAMDMQLAPLLQQITKLA